jgi:uncharacterized protein (TIGR03437 family)
MRNRLSSTSIAVLALVFPMAALADFSNTQTISSGQSLSLVTGSTSSSGADLLFSGTSITPQGSAAFDFTDFGTAGGSTVYGVLTASTLPYLTYTAKPVTGKNLVKDEVFAVLTNGGYYAKVWITAVSSTSLSLEYDTYGAPAGGNTPTISAVLDAGSYTANIAQGSFFVVKGSNLSASGLTETTFPLPTSFGGVSISFAPLTGGPATLAYLDYLYNEGGNNQLAAILPSTVAAGTYNVTVTYNSATSSPLTVQVVKQKPSLITADSTGSGLVVDQNYVSAQELDVNRFTTGSYGGSTISPAHPSQVEIAYLVGSGADPGPDNQPSPGYNFLTNGVSAQVLVDGTTVTPSYLGRVAGGSGYEQINFTLPANVTTGCVVPFQVVENGIASQPTFISIAPAGSSDCVQPGYTPAQLQAFDNGQVVNYGNFSISQVSESVAGMSEVSSSAQGSFVQYSGFELSAIPVGAASTAPTGCSVIQITPSTTTVPSAGGSGLTLDAGKVTLTGPAASGLNSTPLAESSFIYYLGISGTAANTSVVPGSYTLSGAGGTGVRAFTVTMTLPTPLVVTGGLPTTVNRSSGLTLNWTGGNASDGVVVLGYAASISNDFQTGAEFICYTTAGAKTLTVGSSILDQLPAISAAQIANFSGATSLTILTSGTPSAGNGLFNAPLVGGGTITNATFVGSTETGIEPVYQ